MKYITPRLLLFLPAFMLSSAPLAAVSPEEDRLACKSAAAFLSKVACGVSAMGAVGFGYGTYRFAKKFKNVRARLKADPNNVDLQGQYRTGCIVLSLLLAGCAASMTTMGLSLYRWQSIMAKDIPATPTDPRTLIACDIPAGLSSDQAHDRAVGVMDHSIKVMKQQKAVLEASGASVVKIVLQQSYVALEQAKLAKEKEYQAADKAYYEERAKLQATDEARALKALAEERCALKELVRDIRKDEKGKANISPELARRVAEKEAEIAATETKLLATPNGQKLNNLEMMHNKAQEVRNAFHKQCAERRAIFDADWYGAETAASGARGTQDVSPTQIQ
ncbi:MAG: hypothetical protein QG632_821 [Candidatus Dependentiae bacterium]|nr:hypothetical protein [Candidatus Dependentiae bacterium]